MCLTGFNQQSSQSGSKEQPLPFCSFCLREKSPAQDFYKTITNCTPELRKSFQTMLGYDFQLVNFAICRPCWKLMQLVQDVRVRCFKANELVVGSVGQGITGDGGWFSAKTLATFENARMMIRGQTQQIEKLADEVTSTISNESKADEENDPIEVNEQPDDTVEVLESVISIGETKIEQSTDDDETPATVPLFTCTTCSRLFDHKTSFVRHSLVCKSEDKFESSLQCRFCPMTFVKKSSLKFHLNKHVNTKPFQCSKNCTKVFFSADTKHKHERLCFAQPHRTCAICKLQFFNRRSLVDHHKRVHQGVPMIAPVSSHPCQHCQKTFQNVNALRHHMRAHANLATYSCKQCDEVFVSARWLVNHVKKFHAN